MTALARTSRPWRFLTLLALALTCAITLGLAPAAKAYVGVDITSPSYGSTVGPGNLQITGTSAPNERITLTLDGDFLLYALADNQGEWSQSLSIPAEKALTQGNHVLRAQDAVGHNYHMDRKSVV